ncbi:hypothetical protein JCM33374_g3536 [Metschnikowia sp. JCM 33374]|nr:hypothetical protein JCM33374_g3536 [Metschnikowia sp. JCM 33374]
MSFSCTIGQLINHLTAKLAVSEQISLETLWTIAAGFADPPELDGFQKNVVWRGLMSSSSVPLLEIYARNQNVPIHPDLAYGDLLLRGSESEITIRPTEQCQFRYLTNTEDYHMLKKEMGEYPFGLLVVIARHGSEGILNADLARESGQDIRSLRLRLQKLEASGLIVCRNVYINKKHTTHSIHVKFANDSMLAKDKDGEEEGIEVTRDVKKLKMLIMAALKVAPNELRGFSDLRKELKLDGSRSASKFFRSVCIKMHNQGFIEKLHVELPETKQRVYAIQFVKDLPRDFDDSQDFPDLDSNEKDGFDDSDLDDPEADLLSPPEMPALNRVFSPFHQIFHQIQSTETRGLTSSEICKNLLGTADYRPYSRLYEVLPTYLSNSKNLKPFKKYNEPYPEYSVSKLYENEGKLRFYKYFATPFCSEDKPTPKPYNFVSKASKLSLAALNKKLHVVMSKISNEVLLSKKRRLVEVGNASASPPPAKRQKRKEASVSPVKKAPTDPEVPEVPEVKAEPKPTTEPGHFDLDTVDAALLSQERLPRRRRAAPKSYFQEDAMDIGDDSGDEYTPQAEEEQDDHNDHEMDVDAEDESEKEKEDDVEAAEDDVENPEAEVAPTPTLSASDLPTFVSAPRSDRRKKQQPGVVKSEGSLKSIIRRDHLLNIIREEGGATFKNASLCRKLDERLEVKTSTDRKTLSRDIAYLTETGVLEARKVLVDWEGKQHEKRILLLKDPAQRPSEEAINNLKAAYAESMSKKNMKIFEKRLIQSDMKLYVEQLRPQVVSQKTRSRRGKNRLATLGDSSFGASVKEEPSEGVASQVQNGEAAAAEELDIFEKIKRTRRPRKAVPPSVPSFGPKRPRRNIKLDKADATLVYRAVVISKAFSRDAIDFNAIASFLEDIDGKLLKQKWGTLRRSFGGSGAVNKGVETFQNMVLTGVEDGYITEKALVEGDLKFFLDFWRKFDTHTEFSIIDEMPLYSTFAENTHEYSFNKGAVENSSSLSDKIEDLSMRQKEFALGQSILTWECNLAPCPRPDDNLRSILKSIFATGEGNFDPSMVKTVLGKFGENEVRASTDGLLRDKEIAYLAFDDSKKFVLSDRFNASLVSRVLNVKMLHQATAFKEILNDISAVGNGLILSQGVQPGEMCCLLELISEGLVDLTRIDRTFKFENYESRLVDKQQIGCDIVVQAAHQQAKLIEPNHISTPIKGPCIPLWADLNANVNKDLWRKIIIAILSQVVFKPGISDHSLLDKMQAVLTYADYTDAMAWLIESECVRKTSCGGYVATNCWQYILG